MMTEVKLSLTQQSLVDDIGGRFHLVEGDHRYEVRDTFGQVVYSPRGSTVRSLIHKGVLEYEDPNDHENKNLELVG